MHRQFLLAALEQAQLGRGFCAPNPSVGAVAVCNGQIIAQSWHRGAGSAHAEPLILEMLPNNITEIILYVTLEPCNHWGRTPPCVDAIIRSRQIKQVVFAYRDPNPIIALNNTPRILKSHHIEVLHFPLTEIDQFYKSYHHWVKTSKPWVTVKIAQTLNGKIAGENGQRLNISNELCANFTHLNRLKADVILSTAKTVNQDNPLFTARTQAEEIRKPLAILDTHLQLNPESLIFKEKLRKQKSHNDSCDKNNICHIYYDEKHTKPAKRPQCNYYPISTRQGLLDIEMIIYHLGRLGYHDVWVEAGGRLCYALHKANLVNRTHVYIAPEVFGEGATSAYPMGSIFNNPYEVLWQAMGNNMIASFDWLEV